MKKLRTFTLIIIGVLLLSACNLPRANQATPTDTVLTVAAKTVEVQLSAIAATSQGLATNTPSLPTETPVPPTRTPLPPVPTNTQVYIPCDRATFIADVTVPDGTKFNPSQTFTKTWRLKNDGTCTWTTSYSLIFDSGEVMGGSAAVALPGSVAPGQSIDISVNLKAPATAGKYKGFWKLRNASGATFGIGANANVAFWVEIEVGNPTVTVTSTNAAALVIYDFANNYCAASWVSGAGTLPCPGADGDNTGFVIRVDNPTLQNGTTYTGRALETHPEWVDNGVITGRFPPLDVQSGYRLTTKIGCISGGTACDAIFQLNYRADGGSLQNLGSWNMKYSDSPKDLDIDLSSLAGRSVEFVLAVTANGSSGQDWAVWVKPLVIK